MPFRPRVFEEQYRPDPSQTGDLVADAVQTYLDERERAEDRDYLEETRDYERELRDVERGGRARSEVLQDLEFQRTLRAEGLERATPGFVEGARASIEEAPDFRAQGERGLFADVRKGTRPPDESGGGRSIEFRSEREDTSDLFSPTSVQEAFRRARRMDPSDLQKPVVLPGQFQSGLGFARRPMYADDFAGAGAPGAGVEIPGARREPADLRERVSLGGQEFVRTGPSADDRERMLVQDEIERLIAAGVPENIAPFAAEDPVLAREYLEPEEEAEAERTYSAAELVEIGVPEDLARLAELNPDVMDNVVSEYMTRTRPRTATSSTRGFTPNQARNIALEEADAIIGQAVLRAGDNPDVVLDMAAEAIRQDPDLSEHVTPAMVETMVAQALGEAPGGADVELPEPVEERRENIVRRLGSANAPTTQWQQDIVDMLAGIGANGRPSEPLTPEEIIAGYERAGTSEQDIRRIRQFITMTGVR